MPEAEGETTIARPIDVVFEFLANSENDRKWRRGVLEISKISGDGVGTKYHQVIDGPAGRRIEADLEISELEPNRLIAFRTTSGPVQPTGRYELTESGQGHTHVRMSLACELSGLKRAMAPMVKKGMETSVGELTQLKSVLENDAR